jgi:hypothetical protein
MNEILRKQYDRRFTMKTKLQSLLIALILSASIHRVPAQPLLLSYFKLNTDGLDTLSNSFPMQLDGVSFTNNALALPGTGYYTASAQIAGFSYSAFTVAFDFNPTSFGYPNTTLLSGGPYYRWFGLENDAAAHLAVTINGDNQYFNFTNVITTNHWHTLVCSVNMNSQTILTMLDGQMLPPIFLQNIQFNVIGTADEPYEKVFTFWNYGNASFLSGQANNLRIFSGALTASEMSSLNAVSMSVQAFGQGVIITWSSGLNGYVPQWTPSLLPPVQWQDDTRTPLIIGDQRVLIDTPAPGTRFYRLRKF